MYEKIAQEIIERILKQRVQVSMYDKLTSSVSYATSVEKGLIAKIGDAHFRFAKDNSKEKGVIEYLPLEAQELIRIYGIDLFILLHEIGHLKTAKGISIKNKERQKEKLKNYTTAQAVRKAYRNMPVERRADKWAIQWLIKHPIDARRYQYMLELGRNS